MRELRIQLKVEAFGLNRAEVLFRQGLYLEEAVLPSRLGYEAAGIVDAVGPAVSGIQVGDRVSTIPSFSIGKYGVYGESAIVPAHAVAGYPDTPSTVEGAAIWMQYMTAFGALVEYGRVKKQDTLFEIASKPEKMARGKKFIYDGLSSGALNPIIARTFALEEIVEAHHFMESNEQIGKIVVTV